LGMPQAVGFNQCKPSGEGYHMTINICRSQGLGRGGFLVLTSTI